MPEISRFFGIVIAIYYDDHPPPHFHAKYGGTEATIRIADGVVEGDLPRRARSLVLEWLGIHREELLVNWQCAEDHLPMHRIPPLE